MARFAKLTPSYSVSAQITEADVGAAAAQGFKAIINNRPDGEAEEQPPSSDIAAAAKRHGIEYRHIPVISGKLKGADVDAMRAALDELKGPVLAFCRTGTRSTTLWALVHAPRIAPDAILATAEGAGYDLSGLREKLEDAYEGHEEQPDSAKEPRHAGASYDVVIVGGGCAGIAVASSLLKRASALRVAIIEPKDDHYYQPGWTLVGGGVFDREKTRRAEAGLIPPGARWIRAAASEFLPDRNMVVLEDGETVGYRALVVCPGIKLDWDAIPGLKETLGKNGVTSNYMVDMASYTWSLVQNLKGGTAIFTQPPMPIKCAGAPQKAMYLSCSYWERQGRLKDIHVEFNNAGGVLFGVQDYVPPLMEYVKRYNAELCFSSNLKKVDGPAGKAWFEVTDKDGKKSTVEKAFDMIHVCPPQTAPDFIRNSPLADQAGWVEVSPETLQHVRYGNIFGLGDACSAPNAKTAAAVRKQSPTVVRNLLAVLAGDTPRTIYEGYGSCPLTVERGKVVLAEFGYGGQLQPTFPLDSTKPRWIWWILKAKLLPIIYWELLLKGREWLVSLKTIPGAPASHEKAQSMADKAGR
jgi:sulfide:quinone oxidoreductase